MSGVVMVGVSYRNAPLPVLEDLARRRSALARAASVAGAREAVVLSTCCRTELYVTLPSPSTSPAAWAQRLSRELVGHGSFGCEPTVLTGDAVAHHLFRVASGLESRIPGEVDVQAQIRQAVADADAAGQAGPQLRRLFATATATARRIHRETALGGLGRSLGQRAVDVGLALVGDAADPAVAVVGSGRMATAVVHAFTARGLLPVVCGRNPARTAALAPHASLARPLEVLAEILAAADLVVCATSADGSVIDAGHVGACERQRAGRPLTVVDLSIPRSVDAAVGSITGVRLVGLEGLDDDVDGLGSQLRRSLAEADQIAGDEAARYAQAQRARTAGPLIAAVRARVRSVCQEEITRLLGADLDPAAVDRLAAAVAGKLLHGPTVLACEAAAAGDAAALGYLTRIFL